MKIWNQFPVTTRVYLAILGYLIVLLGILMFIRAANLPIGTQIVQALIATDPVTPTPLTTPASGTPGTPDSPFPPGTAWLKAINRATVYTGPAVTFNAPAMLESGQVFPVVGRSEDGQWWAISAPQLEGGKGWVAAGDVIVENAASVPVDSGQTRAAVPTDLLPVAQAITIVNIRSAPNLEGNKIGELANGLTTEIIGKSEDGFWYAVKLPEAPDKSGWVARDYVVARNAEDVPVITEPPVGVGSSATIAPGAPYLTAAWDVNVRAGPGQQFAITGTLKQGTSASIVSKSEDGLWWAINWDSSDNRRGWVAAEFVTAVNGENAPVMR